MEVAEMYTKGSTPKLKKIVVILTPDEAKTVHKAVENYKQSPKAKKLAKQMYRDFEVY